MSVYFFPRASRVVETRLNEASVTPRKWAEVLGAFEAVLPGCSSILYSERISPQRLAGLISHRPGAATRFHHSFDELYSNTPLAKQLSRFKVGAVFTLDTLSGSINRPAAQPNPAAAEGFAGGAGLMLHRAKGRYWALVVYPPAHATGSYDAALVSMLREIEAPLRRAFMIAHGLAVAAAPPASDFLADWDELAYGVLVLDPQLRCLGSNAAADDFLASRAFFAPVAQRRLRLASRDDQARLEEAADRIANDGAQIQHLSLSNPRRGAGLDITIEGVGSDPKTRFLLPDDVPLRPRLILTITPGSGRGRSSHNQDVALGIPA